MSATWNFILRGVLAQKSKPLSEIFRFSSQNGIMVFRGKKSISFQFVLIQTGKKYRFSLWFWMTRILRSTRKVKGHWTLFYCWLSAKMFTESQPCRAEMQLSRSPAKSKQPSGPITFSVKAPYRSQPQQAGLGSFPNAGVRAHCNTSSFQGELSKLPYVRRGLLIHCHGFGFVYFSVCVICYFFYQEMGMGPQEIVWRGKDVHSCSACPMGVGQ